MKNILQIAIGVLLAEAVIEIIKHYIYLFKYMSRL